MINVRVYSPHFDDASRTKKLPSGQPANFSLTSSRVKLPQYQSASFNCSLPGFVDCTGGSICDEINADDEMEEASILLLPPPSRLRFKYLPLPDVAFPLLFTGVPLNEEFPVEPEPLPLLFIVFDEFMLLLLLPIIGGGGGGMIEEAIELLLLLPVLLLFGVGIPARDILRGGSAGATSNGGTGS